MSQQIPPQPAGQPPIIEPKQFNILVPRSTEWRPSTAVSFIRALYDFIAEKGLVLTIRANSENLSWVVTQLPGTFIFTHQSLESFVNQFYPGAQVTERPLTETPHPSYNRYVVFAHQAIEFYDLFTPVTAHARFDPLQLVTQAMSRLEPGERLLFYVFIGEASQPTREEIEQFLSTSAFDAGYRTGSDHSPRIASSDLTTILGHMVGAKIADWMGNQQLKKQKVLRFDDKKTQEYLTKLQQKVALAAVFLTFDTPKKERLDFLTSVVGTVKDLSPNGEARLTDGVVKDALLRHVDDHPEHNPFNFFGAWAETPPEQRTQNHLFPMTAEELACLWHLPHSGFEGQKVNWPASVPPQVVATRREGEIPIGTTQNNTLIAINRADRKYHAYITGQTGMGKSTLLHNLIHQDIISGFGVGVIDPHGKLIRDVLQTSITSGRIDDVVYLRCADPQYPIPLNPFRSPPGVSEIAVFNTVLWIMKSIYKASWSETRMETVMRNILQVVLVDQMAAPLDIQELVGNPNYRRRIVKAANPQLSYSSKNFWKAFEDSSPSEQKNLTQSVLSRLSAFLGSPHIELMTCHPRTLDFRKLISDRKIILVDLHGDAIASEVGTLGAIFLAQFFLASMSLGEIPDNEPPRFYLYVDETQRLITSALPNMFSEARKFGLALTLANQYIGQLDEETREGIVNNVGTKFSFECSPDEARVTAKLFEPHVTQQEMTRLGIGHAAIRTRWQGQTLAGFVAQTLPPPPPLSTQSDLEAIKLRSRENLRLLSKDKVNAWLEKRYNSELFKPSSNEPELKDIG